MCRLLAYLGEPVILHDLLYLPEHSLVKQGHSAHDEEDRVNADGFGVAWYAPEVAPGPAVFRSTRPIWTSRSLRSVSARIRSGLILAHVRAASEGLEVVETNCHPFEAGGLLWMHNGTVGPLERLRQWAREHLAPALLDDVRGTTDSELLLAVFRHFEAAAGEGRSVAGLERALRRSLALLCELSAGSGSAPITANVVVTDGSHLVASRFAVPASLRALSLHYAQGVRVECDATRGFFLRSRPGSPGFLVASEPISSPALWSEVPPGTILSVGAGLSLEPIHA